MFIEKYLDMRFHNRPIPTSSRSSVAKPVIINKLKVLWICKDPKKNSIQNHKHTSSKRQARTKRAKSLAKLIKVCTTIG